MVGISYKAIMSYTYHEAGSDLFFNQIQQGGFYIHKDMDMEEDVMAENIITNMVNTSIDKNEGTNKQNSVSGSKKVVIA